MKRVVSGGARRAFVGVCAVMMLVAGSASAFAQSGNSATVTRRIDASQPQDAQAAQPKARVGLIEIDGAVTDRPGPLDWLMGSEDPTLRQIIRGIDAASRNDAISGIVIRLKDAELSAAQVEELGEALARFRAAGKTVRLFADAYGSTEMMLGSFTDEVIAQPGAPVMMPGLYMEEMFLADTLKWAGVTPDFVQVGDFKGASEMMARNAPSPQWDENINGLLDSLYANMRAPMLRGRKLDDARLDAAMAELWLADAEDAKAAGMIDSVVDLATLDAHLAGSYGRGFAWSSNVVPSSEGMKMDTSNPFAMLSALSREPETTPTRPTIAVVHIDGAIIDGESQEGGFLSSGSSVGSRTIRRALEEIRGQDLVKGVIIRIDSPGGSATASEVIWQGVRRLAEKKPVFVSVGSMAASGGYYIAVAGERIYVNPSSIVGSIGVVGGKLSLAGVYENLRINVTPRARGPRADLFGGLNPWTEAQRAEVRRKMTETYDQFVSRVTAGRPQADISKIAEGRLFTGNRAVELGMADEVGGLQTAITDMAERLELAQYEVMDYPGPKALGEILEDMFSSVAAPGLGGHAPAGAGLASSDIARLARDVVGPAAWPQVERGLVGLLQMRDEPVLLMSPSVLIFKDGTH